MLDFYISIISSLSILLLLYEGVVFFTIENGVVKRIIKEKYYSSLYEESVILFSLQLYHTLIGEVVRAGTH